MPAGTRPGTGRQRSLRLRTSFPMTGAVEDGPARGAEQPGPAGRIAAHVPRIAGVAAQVAGEGRADPPGPAGRLQHPRSGLERRSVPHVALVTA